QAYGLHLEHDNKYEAAFNAKNLAFISLKTGKNEEALHYAAKGIALSVEAGAREMLKDSYLAMARAQAAVGHYQEGYAFQKKYMDLKDSIFEEGRTKAIFELQTLYETEKKEQQIKTQEVQ